MFLFTEIEETVGCYRLSGTFCIGFERESGHITVPEVAHANGIKVAVIGSGPSGLSCAGDLAKLGYDVTVFEALHEIGGVLKYGIPEFRLPNSVVDVEIDNLKKIGVKFVTNFIVGMTDSVEDLKAEGFKAFYVASGSRTSPVYEYSRRKL